MIRAKDHIKAGAQKTELLEQWHVPSLYTLIPKKSCISLKSASHRTLLVLTIIWMQLNLS